MDTSKKINRIHYDQYFVLNFGKITRDLNQRFLKAIIFLNNNNIFSFPMGHIKFKKKSRASKKSLLETRDATICADDIHWEMFGEGVCMQTVASAEPSVEMIDEHSVAGAIDFVQPQMSSLSLANSMRVISPESMRTTHALIACVAKQGDTERMFEQKTNK
ncbi:hypothetical protein BpHYR1_024269 [Brachionus plicatilis]|uniref:Uncharacterized protein n=1 Tax=Brachionus plicatilis TaxID=10195 RepID=A0A3M7PPT1_BRAPC|nr:hypothetical protein BpHYR1_024269 [Brachionus plicatilis]